MSPNTAAINEGLVAQPRASPALKLLGRPGVIQEASCPSLGLSLTSDALTVLPSSQSVQDVSSQRSSGTPKGRNEAPAVPQLMVYRRHGEEACRSAWVVCQRCLAKQAICRTCAMKFITPHGHVDGIPY